MSALSDLDWQGVRGHYDERLSVHQRIISLHERGDADIFAPVLLGIRDDVANYSAAEYGLGKKILGSNENAAHRVLDLASQFKDLGSGKNVPKLVKVAQLSYLGIAVGSECSCMMNPSNCWVTNTRTIWTHLVIKHADNFKKANEELGLYRTSDPSSEMTYSVWADIHRLLETAMTRIAKEGAELAPAQGVSPGEHPYLWADAISNALYVQHHR